MGAVHIEPLESRIAPATFTVTSNSDFGAGSLREMLAQAEQSMGTDIIAFNLPAITTISLMTELAVNSPVIIDGRTQSGYTNSPLVVISGTLTVSPNGLAFGLGSSGSEIHGLAISDFDAAGILMDADNALISGCTITGNQFGIVVGGDNLTVGGTGASGKNVISGNSIYGIVGNFADGLIVQNSNIGVDRDGIVAQGNTGAGIYLDSCTSPTIGGIGQNVISANGQEGIHLVNCFNNVRVTNNFIGIFADGTFNASSRNLGPGVLAFGAAFYVIGTDGMTGLPNYIANNSGPGIFMITDGQNPGMSRTLIAGNIIGSAPQMMSLVPASNGEGAISVSGPSIEIGGSGARPNHIRWTNGDGIATGTAPVRIRENTFVDSAPNASDEVIDILGDGATANDQPDADQVQNFPVLVGAYVDTMGQYRVAGTLTGFPGDAYTIDFYGQSGQTYTHVASVEIAANSSGVGTISQLLPSLAAYSGITATATSNYNNATSEMPASKTIGPAVIFSDTMPDARAEGNTGVTFYNFTASLTAAATGTVTAILSASSDSTATDGVDYSFTPTTLTFAPGVTQQNITVAITGDTGVEPTEYIKFVLGSLMGNAVLLGSEKLLQITNDDTSLRVATDGKSATWKDIDGDLVTLKSTKAFLDTGDFTFEAQGALGGEFLRILDLLNDGAPAKEAGLALTAKFDKVNNLGDGSVHIGYLNATGVDLGIVALPGNLERIAAGDSVLTDGSIKSLTVGSLGLLGSNKLTDGGNYASDFVGKVGALTVKGDVRGARLNASGGAAGSFGAITITGNYDSAGVSPVARITASGDVASLKIGGSMISHTRAASGLFAEGKIGAVTIGGSMSGNGGFVRIFAGTTIGKVTVGGDMDSGSFLAGGKARPSNAAAAIAIASVSVKGHVADSLIAAGLGSGDHGNPDAQIGAVLIGRNWSRSSITAGIDIVNDFTIGDADDAVALPTGPYTNNPAIISKIASITIGGHIYGTSAAGDSFGFVAQSIGKFVRGTTAYTLRPNPTPNAAPLDMFNVSITGDVFVREVI